MKGGTRLFLLGILVLSCSSARPQTPQQLIQQVVDTELKANQEDQSNWIYLEQISKPKEHVVQWVGATQKGDVQRILEKNGHSLSEPEQHDLIDKFLQDPKAQKEQLAQLNHDERQIDDLLKLLPNAFIWTQTAATTTTTSLHFEPDPKFRPPTREARIFASMTGDLVADNKQHRICSMSGKLTRDVTFGMGLLGRLKEGSTFSLSQEAAGPQVWELTAFHIHLQGNALLFKSVSLQEDDERSKYQLQSSDFALDEAALAVMKQQYVAVMKQRDAAELDKEHR